MYITRDERTQATNHQKHVANKGNLTKYEWHGRAYRHGQAVPICCHTRLELFIFHGLSLLCV